MMMMSTSTSIVVQNSKGLLWRQYYLRSKHLRFNPVIDVSFSRKHIINNPSYLACNLNMGGCFSTSSLQKNNNKTSRRDLVAFSDIGAGDPSPPGPPSRNWKGWVLGIVTTIILPFFTNKWGPLATWKDKFDTGLQSVEDSVEAGEKIATVVEKEAEKWLDRLPDGWLKDALTNVEQRAEKTAKFFTKVDDAIDEFQEDEEKIEECLESAEDKAKGSNKEEEEEEEKEK